MTIWVIDADSRAHCLTDTLCASFFVHGTPRELHIACAFIAAARLPVTMRRAARYDLFRRGEIELLEIVVADPARFLDLAQTLKRQFPDLAYYNADISPTQMYFYERGLFPLARVQVETDANARILEIENCDSQWALDYDLPPLKLMTVKLEDAAESCQSSINPNHAARPRPLEIGVEDTTRVLLADDPREMLIRFRELLLQYDPDMIVSAWGDSFILPRLLALSRRYDVPLPLNRDPERAIEFRRARSYFSYGRTVYKTASHLLFGRWHIDCANAFLMDDYSLDGIFELARISQLPVQRVARVSTGTCVSAMEMATAYREQILIPVVKSEAEAWHTAAQFVTADKGGLVFQPLVGLHEAVAELDFTSMFPTIMDKFNLSAETLNCPCCAQRRVPELGFWVCQKRRGLIPKTIAPLVAKRSQYKRKVKETTDPAQKEKYKRRVSCLKWALVTVFGYTGYRNARFGKIEAHEAINAYGRDALLAAKELAEARGFQILHAIVDALYIQKARPGPSPDTALADECAELTRAIAHATNLPIELEGIYRWICFPPSRQDAHLGVANRYFGVFADGELKTRGIEARRHDTPLFIKQAQTAMLEVLAQAKNRAEFRARMTDVTQLAAAYLDTLYAGQIPFAQLAITQRLSRDPRTYQTNSLNALVAGQLLESGVELAAGESIKYVILDNRARLPADRARPLEHLDGSLGYDAKRYAELLVQSVTTLFSAVGVSQSQLEKHFDQWRALSQREPLPIAAPRKELPLFEWAKQPQPKKVRTNFRPRR
jgi:DNA polymerase-2